MFCHKCWLKIEGPAKGHLSESGELEMFHPDCYPEDKVGVELSDTTQEYLAKALIGLLKVAIGPSEDKEPDDTSKSF